MNPGGIRADVNPGETAPGDVTYGEAFTVQPFGNNLVTLTYTGAQLDAAATYRVTVNSLLADGGDGFKVLAQATERLGGVVDTDAFEAYFGANSPVAPGPADRITTTGTPPTTAPPTTVTTAAGA